MPNTFTIYDDRHPANGAFMFGQRRENPRDSELVVGGVGAAGDTLDTHAHLRAAKFAALADLFSMEPKRLMASVHMLMQPCPGVGGCPVAGPAIAEAGRAALEWARDTGDEHSLHDERVALFGEPDVRDFGYRLPARGELYLSDGTGDIDRQVEAVYSELGFEPGGPERFASHIVNELAFMSHLLNRVAQGDSHAERQARDFLVSHLLTWAVVFSAATHARAEHPVTRFAGMMLEHLLFCQAEQSRRLLSHRATA